jgi:hypothetical protein
MSAGKLRWPERGQVDRQGVFVKTVDGAGRLDGNLEPHRLYEITKALTEQQNWVTVLRSPRSARTSARFKPIPSRFGPEDVRRWSRPHARTISLSEPF